MSNSVLNEGGKEEEADNEDTNIEEFLIQRGYEFTFWKRLIMLPYYPTWLYMLMIIGYIQTCSAIYFVSLKELDGRVKTLSNNVGVFNSIGNACYFVDIILVIVCKNVSELFISPTEIRRPNWILCLEMFSTIPLHLILPTKPTTLFKVGLYYCFHLKDCLKSLRIINAFRYHQNLMRSKKTYIALLECVCYLLVVVFIMFLITYHEINSEQNLKQDNYTEIIYISVIRTTSYGYTLYPEGTKWMLSAICIGLTFCMLKNYFRALIIWTISVRATERYKFRNRFHLIQLELKTLDISKNVINSTKQFYQTSWKLQNIYAESWKNLSTLPPSMNEELSVEIFWFAFMHSKLFRNFNLPFLRLLSMSMKSELKIAGEILFDKGSIKSKMIYVQSGVIQILSEEDDETPIFSFSGGTCLGESGLILAYKSNAIVRCKSSCRLHVLRQKDYIKTIGAYSKEFIQLKNEFYQRLDQAKENRALSKKINDKYNNGRTNYMTVMWLKSTLHKLMSKDEATFEKHVCQNIFLREEFDEDKFKNRHFTADNLDLIAISERLELITDSVFLKSSFPCILQPNSILLGFWNCAIAFFACTAGIIVPYYAFLETLIPLWYGLYICCVTILWWVDLYIQASTAIKTSDKIIAEVKTIFMYRMRSFSFLLDIVAAIPLEMFSSIILTDTSKSSILLIEVNRVVKIQKLYGIYKNWKSRITSNNFVIIYCWYQLCCLYITYIVSCFLYYLNSSEPTKTGYVHFAWYFFSIFQTFNGVSISNPLSQDTLFYGCYIFTCFTAVVVDLLYFTYINSIYSLVQLDAIKLNELYKHKLITVNLGKYDRRISENIEAQLLNTGGYEMIYSQNPYVNLPRSIYNKIALEKFKSLLSTLRFFHNFPDELILELCVYCQTITIPPYEVLCCTGQMLDRLIILETGFCSETTSSSLVKKNLKAPMDLAFVETYGRSPVINTVVTATHCRIVTIPHSDFIKVFLKYPSEKSHFDSTLYEIDVVRKLSYLYDRNQTYPEYDYVSASTKTKSFKYFGYNLPVDSFEEYEYYVPFDRLRNLSFVQYFLMRSTILPDGKFLLTWELVKCCCAVTSAVLFSLVYTNAGASWALRVIMVGLDAMAWADIYVRLHVCYYNKNGILVSHPSSTAEYYLKHAFIVDILSVFPFKLIVDTKNPQTLTALQLNRVLQMYRYLGIGQVIAQKRRFHPVQLLLFQYIAIFLVVSFVLSYFTISTVCSISSNASKFDVVCTNNSWPVLNKFVDPLTPLKLQFYGVYFVASIVTQSGMQGYNIMSLDSAINVAILTMLKNVLILYLACKVTKLYTIKVSALSKYQSSMRMLINFMQKFNTKGNLQLDLITHFELKWFRFKGTNILASTSNFHDAFKQDILYDIYGKVLEDSLIFPCDCDRKSFFRSLLLEVSHDMVTRNGFATKINDVNEWLNIICKGKALVIGADGSKIAVLTQGSIFGNLIECQRSRQTVTVQAVGHIEILIVKTTTFYQLLKKYNRLYDCYKRLIGFHTDFLSSKCYHTDDYDNNGSSSKDYVRTLRPKRIFFNQKVFDPENVWLRIWKILILTIVCYLETAFTLYQIALGEYSLVLVVLQYLCDVLYLINYYVKTHTGFENEEGVIIYDLKAIRDRLSMNKLTNYCEIISLIPLDQFCWFLPVKVFRIVHSILRLNRPIRFFFFITYLRQLGKMLHNNPVAIRTLQTFVWITYFLHSSAVMSILLSCYSLVNMQPSCDCINSTSSHKYSVYVSYLYIVSGIFTGTAQSQFYPISSVLILYFSILMIFAAIIRAIVLGQIYSTLQLYYNQRNEYNRKFDVIKGNMDLEQISPALYDKIINYLKLLWRTEKGVVYPNLLREAPYCLREAILNDAFSDHIHSNSIFTKCHRDFNRQVVSCLKIETFFEGDYIVFKGSDNGCMYFIHNGTVKVISEDVSTNLKLIKLKKGSCFGIAQGIFIGKRYLHSFQALKTTTILTLEFSAWKHLLDFYPASRNTIFEEYFLHEYLYA